MFNWSLVPSGAVRSPIEKAIHAIEKRYSDREESTSICIAPRVGKSDIVRIVAMRSELIGCPWVLALSPWTTLAKQLVNEEKKLAFLKRTNHATFPSNCFESYIKSKFDRNNGDRFVSATYAWAGTRQDHIVAAIQEANGTPIIIGDEAHLLKTGNSYLSMVKAFVQAGAHFVSMTGTAYTDIYGFEKINEISRDIGFVSCQNIRETEEGVRLADLVEYQGKQQTFKIKGHVNFYMKDAWNATFVATIDAAFVALVGEIDGEVRVSSSMTKTEVRERRTAMLRHPETIRGAIKMTLDRFAIRKKIDPKSRCLVFSMDDRGTSRANDHAQSIIENIESISNIYSVAVCTMNNDLSGSTDDKSEHLIEAFTMGVPGEKYKGDWGKRDKPVTVPDILVVKTMGGTGMDVGPLSTVCDLSNVRTLESCGQRWLRGGTMWQNKTTYDLILVDEPDVRELYQELVINAGGDTDCKSTVAEEKNRTEIVLDENYVSPFRIHDTINSEVSDSNGRRETSGEKIGLIDVFFERVPELLMFGITRADLSTRLHDYQIGGKSLSNQTVEAASNVQLDNLSSECEGLRSKIASHRNIKYEPGNSSAWESGMRDIQESAMRLAGLSYIEVKDSNGKQVVRDGKTKRCGMNKDHRTDLAEWKRYRDALHQILCESETVRS